MATIWILMLLTTNGGQVTLDPIDGVRFAFSTKGKCEQLKAYYERRSAAAPGREHDVWI